MKYEKDSDYIKMVFYAILEHFGYRSKGNKWTRFPSRNLRVRSFLREESAVFYETLRINEDDLRRDNF